MKKEGVRIQKKKTVRTGEACKREERVNTRAKTRAKRRHKKNRKRIVGK